MEATAGAAAAAAAAAASAVAAVSAARKKKKEKKKSQAKFDEADFEIWQAGRHLVDYSSRQWPLNSEFFKRWVGS